LSDRYDSKEVANATSYILDRVINSDNAINESGPLCNATRHSASTPGLKHVRSADPTNSPLTASLLLLDVHLIYISAVPSAVIVPNLWHVDLG